jgi:uncharacterized integral membrane protein
MRYKDIDGDLRVVIEFVLLFWGIMSPLVIILLAAIIFGEPS